MPRVKTSAQGAKGKGKGKDMQDPYLSPAKLSSGFSVNSVPVPPVTPRKSKKNNSGNDVVHQVSFQQSRSAGGSTDDVTTNPKSPRTPHNTHSGRANSASRELPLSRSSKHHQKSSQNVSSGGGKGKVTPLSARKHVVKTGKRFRPGTLALKEIKRL